MGLDDEGPCEALGFSGYRAGDGASLLCSMEDHRLGGVCVGWVRGSIGTSF